MKEFLIVSLVTFAILSLAAFVGGLQDIRALGLLAALCGLGGGRVLWAIKEAREAKESQNRPIL